LSINARLGFLLMCSTLIVGASVVVPPYSTTPVRAIGAFSSPIPDAAPASEITLNFPDTEAQPNLHDERGLVDLYGNDVTAAVATYTLDADGSLYELHSPQTELPRLASPKS
jgi:hypothetical protein